MIFKIKTKGQMISKSIPTIKRFLLVIMIMRSVFLINTLIMLKTSKTKKIIA